MSKSPTGIDPAVATADSACERSGASAEHIPALDGVRGIAILMVIVCHFAGYGLAHRPPRAIAALAAAGGTGVDLFFVLSGFLITRILLRTRDREGFLRNFYARRVLRIFPLYFGFVAFLYILVPVLHLGEAPDVRTQLWTWTYLQNVAMTFFPSTPRNLWQWTPHFWSLAVEEHFYLVWPFVVKFADRRRLPGILLATVPLAIVSRWAVMSAGYGAAYLTPCRVDALGLGSLLAVIAINPRLYRVARRYTMPLMAVLLPATVAGAVVLSGSGAFALELVKNTMCALLYASLLFLVLELSASGAAGTLLSRGVLPLLGKYSYGMYVFHLTLLGLLGPYIKAVWPPLGFLLLTGTTLATAALSWHAFEARFLRLKRYFPGGAAEPARPAAFATNAG